MKSLIAAVALAALLAGAAHAQGGAGQPTRPARLPGAEQFPPARPELLAQLNPGQRQGVEELRAACAREWDAAGAGEANRDALNRAVRVLAERPPTSRTWAGVVLRRDLGRDTSGVEIAVAPNVVIRTARGGFLSPDIGDTRIPAGSEAHRGLIEAPELTAVAVRFRPVWASAAAGRCDVFAQFQAIVPAPRR